MTETDHPVLSPAAPALFPGVDDDRFGRVVEYAPNAMILTDPRGIITMVNAETEKVFGYRREELLGQAIEMLVPERFRHHHSGLRGSFVLNPGPRPMGPGRDLYALRKDGSEFAVEIGLNPIPIGDQMHILAAIVDISDRKTRQQHLERSLREKELLLAEVHHRVKNNLQIVYSLLDLQSAQIEDPGIREMLRDSCNRVRSMAQVHQTLYQSEDVSQVELGHFFDDLLRSLHASYVVDSSRIAINTNISQVFLPIGSAVPCGLIANELLSNALKHAFPGGREGKIDVFVGKSDANTIRIDVSDNGVGLPEKLDVENSTSLGLQLVYMLVDQLHGTISVNHANPTCLSVEFPATEAS
ncbi:sensor histidine kinase [Thalassospira marina]|uniref:histidine kinase n=1 Tax=Thalassospira marina TaxID=2048283 RepID=A0ABM6Q811_9PROT|nr:histidine kinase dimerization/phosphoacceptor domain -containing protein [Thalassospira marina]AUG52097.1 histidine kinase [Thalassospira marina]